MNMITRRLIVATHAALLLLSLGCGSGRSGVEEGATTSTSDHEIPGAHDPGDLSPITAEQWIDQVRVGRKIDVNGRVPETAETETFSADDPIHVSLEVTDAPAGTEILVSVADTTTGKLVLSERKHVLAGRRYLTFSWRSGELHTGEYRAEVIVGDEKVASRNLTVLSNSA